ncbi:MAG TPA: rRNA maturation RNase YbeY [Verrucomicrobia bacterium]|nr:rRNA maturation RNase YbeY [Verrucomicrobiota bacterium]HOB32298.1 rRNA maturation RNase YbeY [Verrucomicrobiota bacterium]HOP96125.1 rRNA maturation RNase YbeY [Verrucomicrobiota bacterium]HPU57595.1 rRNA maturation RNase YbeY [Verrucomicrobiota bacterium]
MNASLVIRNRQRKVRLDQRRLARIARELLRDALHVDEFEIGLFIVGSARMAELNRTHLQHEGSTDVITFAYQESPGEGVPPRPLQADIFLCIDEAIRQARQYRTSWQSELVRYLIHGLLHACGYDDLQPAKRRRMKREEDRLLKRAGRLFALRALGGRRT